MARIRSIKPDFWTDSKTGPLSELAKCLFIGILNHADDCGVIEYNPTEWGIKIFPYHSRSTHGALTEDSMREILPLGLITVFSLSENDSVYCYIKNFAKHQVINRPSLPLLEGWNKSDNPRTYAERQGVEITILSLEELREYSVSTHTPLIHHSHPEGKGGVKERKGKKIKKKTLLESGESSLSLSRWFDEVMWPAVPKKVGKDLTWLAIQKLKPNEETREKIVRYFTEYPKVKATYDAAGEVMAEMQDPVRVIKNYRFEDVLEPLVYKPKAGGMAQPSDHVNGKMPKLNIHLWPEERIKQKLKLEGDEFRKAMLDEGLDPKLYEED